MNLLSRAIRSALDQTCRDVRVVVYDNASLDGTEPLVRALAERDSRVEYYRHPRNIGGAANIAFGMARVATPFFSILCDDDVLLPRFYEIALREFERFPPAMFVGASTLEITDSGELVFAPAASWDRVGLFDPDEGLRRMVGGKHPTMTNVAFRRELVDDVGTVDPEAGTLLDLDYYIRACTQHPCAITREVAGFFVRHPNAWSDSGTSVDSEFERLIRKSAGVPWLAATLAAQRDRRLFQLALRSLGRGDREGAVAAARALELHGGGVNAAIVVALAAIARYAPPLSWAIRQVYALRLRMLGRQCVARLRRLRERGAANGFREELAYFKMLNASDAGAPATQKDPATQAATQGLPIR
jgi:glycosyltransferase involved in cell wall biosynthesis